MNSPLFAQRRSLVALALASMVAVSTSRADVLLVENAESGAANVLDNTAASYDLIQSDVVAEGSHAFHLANPQFQDNWFSINEPLSIQADSKLFFLSRLGFAASGQIAKVQMSTNGGATWPTTLYSQTGTSTGSSPVEGAFSLKTVDLAPYAGQSAMFRFYLDYVPGGLAFTDVNHPVGWYLDNIQVADQFQKQQYSIGNPSADAQQYLEYVNRARADAIVEANRLMNETDPDVTSAYSFFGIEPQDIVDQFTASVASGLIEQTTQPLSFNEKLLTAAQLHTQDMFDNQFQGHDSSGNPPAPLTPFGSLDDRLEAVGYSGGAGENVYSHASSAREGHAGFDVDWGDVSNPSDPAYNPAFVGQGMQNPAGHRRNLHHGAFKEIGIGVLNGTNGSVGPQLVTQDFGDPGAATFITGVVYQDVNNNSFYDVGEGRSGVRIDVEGSAYFAISAESGGYSVPVDGQYTVRFQGGGFESFTATAKITGGLNYKVDYLTANMVAYAADFDNDSDVDADDLSKWVAGFGVNALGDADDDGDSDGADFLIWQQQLGLGAAASVPAAAVPEPAAATLLLWAMALVRRCRSWRDCRTA
ncbi:MAG: CAP domain-containing protein [Pirellulales bacterium]|nr:CAP domain-containing protein [Pirellulales bacterium]